MLYQYYPWIKGNKCNGTLSLSIDWILLVRASGPSLRTMHFWEYVPFVEVYHPIISDKKFLVFYFLHWYHFQTVLFIKANKEWIIWLWNLQCVYSMNEYFGHALILKGLGWLKILILIKLSINWYWNWLGNFWIIDKILILISPLWIN